MSSKVIGIIGAMDIEVNSIIASMKRKKEKVIGSIRFVSGRIYGKKVVVAKCGIGKVFAALCAQTMILNYKPSVIVNTGVAGSLKSGLNVLDVVIASSVVQHDMDTSAIGDPKGLISGINVINIDTDKKMANIMSNAAELTKCRIHTGVIASGDKFISNKDEKNNIRQQFDAVACEMEGAAIGQVCYVNEIPFLVLRTISDGDGAEMDYMEFAPKAAEQAAKIVDKFIFIYGEDLI